VASASGGHGSLSLCLRPCRLLPRGAKGQSQLDLKRGEKERSLTENKSKSIEEVGFVFAERQYGIEQGISGRETFLAVFGHVRSIAAQHLYLPAGMLRMARSARPLGVGKGARTVRRHRGPYGQVGRLLRDGCGSPRRLGSGRCVRGVNETLCPRSRILFPRRKDLICASESC
jgi:hypothetical protein